jgi:hypothetical protein
VRSGRSDWQIGRLVTVPASRARQEEVATRRAEALRMRLVGMSTAVIKAELGYSSEGAVRMDLTRALRAAAEHQAALGLDGAVALELERLDLAERTVQGVRLTAQRSQEYAWQALALAATDRLMRIHDRRRRLLAMAAAGAPARAAGPDEVAIRRAKRRNRFSAQGAGL